MFLGFSFSSINVFIFVIRLTYPDLDIVCSDFTRIEPKKDIASLSHLRCSLWSSKPIGTVLIMLKDPVPLESNNHCMYT